MEKMSDFLLEKLQKSVFFQILLSVFCIMIGLFWFIFPVRDDVPILREEAQVYSGYFDKYESGHNYRTIVFTDGSTYSVYPHTESEAFGNAMKTMERGTELSITVNPNSGHVIEVRSNTEELLNFEASQKEIYQHSKGYIWIGVLLCILPVLLSVIFALENQALKKEKERRKKKKEKAIPNSDTPALRIADIQKTGRILLNADVKGYQIVYRRIKLVNELIVNGKVYDEHKALIEVAHRLEAVIDNHKIEAGLDKDSFSYIKFDDKKIAKKKRIV